MKLILAVLFLWGAVDGSVKLANIPSKSLQSIDAGALCTTIKFVDPSRKTVTRESVLREVCEKGVHHIVLDDKLKQFAIFNIHRDNFDSVPKWIPGDAKNVVNDPSWEVNSVKRLSTSGYQWYDHGLPMWPLPFQALAAIPSKAGSPPGSPTTGRKSPLSLLKKSKVVDWPNYGFATPVYFASNAWRNQAWSMEEFFQEQLKLKPTKQNPSKFTSTTDFHKLVKTLIADLDSSNVETYSSWPFLQNSLQPMIESMVRRNKGLCPDELYIYTHYTPCHPREAAHLACTHAALQARTLLTQANCRTTDVIQGYSKEYNNNAL